MDVFRCKLHVQWMLFKCEGHAQWMFLDVKYTLVISKRMAAGWPQDGPVISTYQGTERNRSI